MRVLHALALLVLLLFGSGASAHTSLVGSDPPTGAVLPAAPASFELRFTEPVAPTALNLVAGDGQSTPLTEFELAGNKLRIAAPPGLADGTYALTWRVVSQDGHPVGGSVVFSIGVASGESLPVRAENGIPINWPLYGVRVLLYLALLGGIGGAVFSAVAGDTARGSGFVHGALYAGVVLVSVSIGLQGLDVLGAPLHLLFSPKAIAASLATSYGPAAVGMGVAALLALASLQLVRGLLRTLAALAAVLILGASFAATGHASAAPPQWLARPSVAVHVVGVALWVGALVPLLVFVRAGDAVVLRRFSATIPWVVVAIVASGLALAIIQVGAPAALWETAYGRVLLVKLALLAILFVLAAVNRWRLTRPAESGNTKARGWLVRLIVVELLVVVAIAAVVAVWRFTPPPRSLAAASERAIQFIMLQGRGLVANVTLEPGRTGRNAVLLGITRYDNALITPKEVQVIFAKPDGGIEKFDADAASVGEGIWQASDVLLPIGGTWDIQVAILVSDFELVRLNGRVNVED